MKDFKNVIIGLLSIGFATLLIVSLISTSKISELEETLDNSIILETGDVLFVGQDEDDFMHKSEYRFLEELILKQEKKITELKEKNIELVAYLNGLLDGINSGPDYKFTYVKTVSRHELTGETTTYCPGVGVPCTTSNDYEITVIEEALGEFVGTDLEWSEFCREFVSTEDFQDDLFIGISLLEKE